MGASMKRLLFLTFYYPPDLCAGSFRAFPLVNALSNATQGELEIEVFTTAPNRYSTHQVTAPAVERLSNVTVVRAKLPSHKSGMVDQIFAFRQFTSLAKQHVRGRRYDMIFATSSRLMTASLGARLSRQLNCPLILDIRDLFPDTICSVIQNPLFRLCSRPILDRIESQTIRAASHVNVVSPGYIDHIKGLAPKSKVTQYTNGIDNEFLHFNFTKTAPVASPRTILYAGNIGESQGLQYILPKAAKRLEGTVNFIIIGDGGRKLVLEEQLRANVTDNVQILKPMSRSALIEHYKNADLLFLHLNDRAAFDRALPSKIFEYGAIGKPIVAGVRGVAADFLRAHLPDTAIFEPGCVDGLVHSVNSAIQKQQKLDRAEFCRAFSRKAIMEAFSRDILAAMGLSSE